MPWFDLMDELEEIICAPEWDQAKDVCFLQNALYAQIGANAVFDDMEEKAAREPEPLPPTMPKPGRGGTFQ